MQQHIKIKVDDLSSAHVIQLMEEHFAEMRALSPAESVHALDIDELKHPNITFYSALKSHDFVGLVVCK